MELLQTELDGQLTGSASQIIATPLPAEATIAFPQIAVYPGNWEINQTLRETRSHELRRQELSTIREFQQEFWIDIYDQDFAAVERLCSLITGILLNSHDALIDQYNDPADSHKKTEYQTGKFVTTHSLNHFRLLTGTQLRLQTGVGMQLKLTAIAQMKATKAMTAGAVPIQKVRVTGRAVDQTLDTEVD